MKEKILKYTVIYEPAEEGGYVVRVPALGCATQGDTLEDAEAMARECIEAQIWALRHLKQEVPVEPEGIFISQTAVSFA